MDGAAGRYKFDTHYAYDINGHRFDSSKLVFSPLNPKQFYLTTGFKELAMIIGDTEESFRKTSKLINHVRYQMENGTPHRTLHDQTQKEGVELINHLKEKADALIYGNFNADGTCINPDISSGGDPITLSMNEVQKAASKISSAYNPIELFGV